MEIDMTVIRYCLLFLFTTLTSVNCEGTLYVTLQRYQNDTCGGLEPEGGSCYYSVSLTIQSYIFRGSDLIENTDHYQLSDGSKTFNCKDNNNEIKFAGYTILGPVQNPIPIKLIEGTINFTFAVNNSRGLKIFETTYAFNADSIKPYSVTQLYSDFNSTGTLALSSNLKCASHFTGTGCQECEEAWYGARCEVRCEQSMNYTCQPVTGKKMCEENHYGDKCERYCRNTTRYTCTEHGNKLCVYPVVGSDCNSSTRCPEHKYGAECNITCHPAPGHFLCGENGTRVCDGHFTGPDCSSCTDHHYGAHCNVTCEPPAPRYMCNAAGQRVCADMWFGERCEVFCNTSSHLYSCTDSGSKNCTGNRAGEECNCRDNFYGPDCQVKCKHNQREKWTCDPNTGEKICNLNRAGKDCSCIKDHYEVKGLCKKCLKSDKYTCTTKGEKMCKATWYGKECDIPCLETERYSCLDSGAKQCKGNFAGAEEDCGSCIYSHYGKTCEVSCVETTISKCDPQTGALQCKEGFYGLPSCKVYCDTTSRLYDCNSQGEKECKGNRDNGTECETCIEDWYGDNCNTLCVSHLSTMECAQNGSLVCKQGWAGEECLECAAHWYGSTCSESDWWTGTCSKTCDTFCIDLTDYKCNSEGVLEMTPEFAALWYSDDHYYELKVAGIVIGFFLVYLFATFLMYKIAFCWYPAGESK